mmetsp:Transcript_21677/g.84466  ORF Transcript_21677/g.84466 Transcript_21677/m.84466 type:complete len:526 (+) Transcript_21677:1337-2914(+)
MRAGPVLHLAGQLAAGSIDIVAARLADGRHDAGLDQHLGEGLNPRIGAAREPRGRKRIERDQVELAGHLALQQLDQFARLLGRVVHLLQHAVLEGDEVARRAVEVAVAGVEQFGDGVFLVQRHELIAQRVGRGMQTHRKRHRAILAQPVDHRHHARRGHRHPTAAQAIAMVVQHGLEGRHELVVVLQRLAHAHHHDVRDHPFVGVLALAQGMLGEPQLGHDFGGRQVAAEALVAGRAEAAAHRTAGLAGHAQRAAVVFGDEYGFDRIARADIEQPLDRAVGRDMLGDDIQRADDGTAGELLAQRLGEVGHLFEVRRALLVDPAKQLGRTELLFAQLLAVGGQAWQIKTEQVDRVHTNFLGRGHRPRWGSATRVDVHAGEEERDLGGCRFGGVGAVHGVGIDAVGEVGADGALLGFLRVGGAHQVTVLQDGTLALQGLDHDRAGDHEVHQVIEEGAGLVDGVELLGLDARQMHHLGGDDLQAGGLEAGIDLADDVLRHGIGLDDGQGGFDRHGVLLMGRAGQSLRL